MILKRRLVQIREGKTLHYSIWRVHQPKDLNSCILKLSGILFSNQYLDYRGKKMLRGVSSTLKNRVEGCGDKEVHYWRFSKKFRTAQLKKFADQVETVLGLEVGDVTHDGLEYFVEKHTEIMMFHLGGKITVVNRIVSRNRLSVIFSIPFLSSLNISMRQYFVPKDLKIA